MIYLIVVSVFLATALLTAAILYPLLARRGVVHERLQQMMPAEAAAPASRWKTIWNSFLGRLGGALPVSPAEQSKYTRMIVAAGYRKERTHFFLGTKVLLTIVLPAAYLMAYAIPKGAVLSFNSILYTAILTIVGFLLPSYWLTHKVKNRQTEIFHSLPDVLDLLTVCVEAGMSIDAALIKVSEDPQFTNNPLAVELKQVSREIRLGKPKTEALREMGERTKVDDIKAFTSMLIHTERFGTSLAQALRVHSDSLRTIRTQRAEETAAKATLKMLFPLVFLIFPAILLIILGPAIIRIYETLLK